MVLDSPKVMAEAAIGCVVIDGGTSWASLGMNVMTPEGLILKRPRTVPAVPMSLPEAGSSWTRSRIEFDAPDWKLASMEGLK